jgi:hypothetical protein
MSSPVLDENKKEGFPKMRCVDVIRELAAPTDMRDAVGLADHLNQCSACANWARQAEQLDQLWDLTRPSEPAPEVWDNMWSQVALSLDNVTAQEVASPSLAVSHDHSTGTSKLGPNAKPARHSATPPIHGRFWQSIGHARLARVAAVLLVAGLSLWFFIVSRQDVASLKPAALNPTGPDTVASAALPSVDIETGHLVVILADPNSPSVVSVVDRTPKAIIAGVSREYVDWYGDERSFDWSQVFNEVESLATPKVAWKE